MEEIWKDVPGYEGLYQVSNIGRIKRLSRLVKNGHTCFKKVDDLIMSSRIGNNGYPYVNLSIDDKPKSFYIHRLIAIAFIQNDDNKPHVNHKNGIRSDYRIENLEWCTQSENNQHAYSVLGRKTWIEGRRGAKCPNSKPVLQFTKNGEFVKIYAGMHEASRVTGVGLMGICDCCNGKAKTAKKYKWLSLSYDYKSIDIKKSEMRFINDIKV